MWPLYPSKCFSDRSRRKGWKKAIDSEDDTDLYSKKTAKEHVEDEDLLRMDDLDQEEIGNIEDPVDLDKMEDSAALDKMEEFGTIDALNKSVEFNQENGLKMKTDIKVIL